MKKSAIYVRVSTTYQIDKDSLPLQRNDLINYSKLILGIDDYVVFEDAGFSGKNTDRPAFKEMINRIEKGEFSHLLVWKIDRISRNLLDFCEIYEKLKKYNCSFISKNEQFDTSSAIGETMLKIILVFAELERKLTAERVTATMLARAQKGSWNGSRVPLGYDYNHEIKFPSINPEEAKTVKLIFKTYRDYESTTYVRDFLNTSNIKTKRGGRWTTKTIHDIIRNPFYKGTYRYNYRESARGKLKDKSEWIIIDDNHEAIVSKELWDDCNNIMDSNAKRNGSKFRQCSKTHIFASLMHCDECKGILYAKQDKPNLDGFRGSLYVCKSRYNTKTGCSQKTVSEKIIGNFVFNLISNILKLKSNMSINEAKNILLQGKEFKNIIDIKNIDSILKLINTSSEETIFKFKNNKKSSPSLFTLENELIKTKRSLAKLEDLYLFDDSEMTKEDYLIKKDEIKIKILELEVKINNLNSEIDLNFELILNAMKLELSKSLLSGGIEIKDLIVRLDRYFLKEFVNTLIDSIYVLDRQVTKIQFKNGLEIKFEYKK